MNARYIQRLEKNVCIMMNGKTLPVSRYKKESAKKQYIDYIRNRNFTV